MKIHGVVAVAALMLLVTQSACSAGSDNFLIGKWKLAKAGYTDRDGRTWCQDTQMQFTASSRTLWVEANPQRPATTVTEKVSYLVSKDKVYVTNSDSFYNAASYSSVAGGQIESDDIGHCFYSRE